MDGVKEVSKLEFKVAKEQTPLTPLPLPHFRFETIPLEYVKKLKSEGGVSLNDVLFTCLGGAIRRYNISQNCEATEKKKKKVCCRALMPVAFPRPNVDKNDKTAVLRNKWVFISGDFGVGYEDVIERLRFVNQQMNGIKNSPLAGNLRGLCSLAWSRFTFPAFVPIPAALSGSSTLFTTGL